MHAFFSDPEVLVALQAGVVAALLCSLVGVFVVMRHQSFAGHAITDIGFTGGSGAPLAHVNPLAGLLAFAVGGALAMGRLEGRVRERDVATGVVLTLALAFASLLLFFATRYASHPETLLFGSIFALDPSVIKPAVGVGALAIAALALLYRPLLFASVVPESAGARGVPVGLLAHAFLVLMAIAVTEAAQIVGVLLTTALLIGPAATALALSRRMERVLVLAAAIAIAQTIAGIALAYASYWWPPGGKGWPTSFFIGALALLSFVAARIWARRRAGA